MTDIAVVSTTATESSTTADTPGPPAILQTSSTLTVTDTSMFPITESIVSHTTELDLEASTPTESNNLRTEMESVPFYSDGPNTVTRNLETTNDTSESPRELTMMVHT